MFISPPEEETLEIGVHLNQLWTDLIFPSHSRARPNHDSSLSFFRQGYNIGPHNPLYHIMQHIDIQNTTLLLCYPPCASLQCGRGVNAK